MSPQDLDLAADFCKLVGAPHLVAYLGAQETDEPMAVQAKLKSRRRFMQGMQGNPKYKREALFLIRHYSTLHQVLDDVEAYLADARDRSESVHLPVLEMTIRGILAAGAPTSEQTEYLRRNAVELGVSDATFERVLTKAAEEYGVSLDPSAADTGPPARVREFHQEQPLEDESATSTLEVSKPHVRVLRVTEQSPWLGGTDLQDGIAVASLKVRNVGEGAMAGTISANVTWLAIDPSRLDPDAKEQEISIQADPADIPEEAKVAEITISTEDGDSVVTTWNVRRGPSPTVVMALIGAIIAMITLTGIIAALT